MSRQGLAFENCLGRAGWLLGDAGHWSLIFKFAQDYWSLGAGLRPPTTLPTFVLLRLHRAGRRFSVHVPADWSGGGRGRI